MMTTCRRIPSGVMVCLALLVFVMNPFGLSAGLTNLQAPLADRILTDDGDFAEVPIWKWANDITGDKAAIVLGKTGELDSFMLHRTWRRGQTVGQAVRAVEDYLGRFRVHFERDTMTFISLSAHELQSKTTGANRYQGWTDDKENSGYSWKIALLGGIADLGDEVFSNPHGIIAGGEISAPLYEIFDVVFRFEYNDYLGPSLIEGSPGTQDFWYSSFFSGLMVRVMPWQNAVVTPYAHLGLSFSVEDTVTYDGVSDPSASKNSFGLVAGGGVRVGPPESFMLMLEAGWRTGGFNTFFQLRAGLMIEL